jgi:hypothetical protein
MIGQHPQMYGLPELKLNGADTMREWWAQFGPGLSGWIARAGLLRAVAQLYFGDQTEETIVRAREWVQSRFDLGTAEVFRELTEKIDPRIAVEKSPPFVTKDENLDRLLKFFPNARFLHLLRHPRSTCLSLLKPEWVRFLADMPEAYDYGTNPPTLDPQMLWYDIHTRIMAFTERLPAAQAMQLQGEKMLMDPDRHLRSIAAWLGVRGDAAALDEMKHPERSPFACFGPRNAPFGNDVQFLRNPELRAPDIEQQSLDGPLPWRPDGCGFLNEVKGLARDFGY